MIDRHAASAGAPDTAVVALIRRHHSWRKTRGTFRLSYLRMIRIDPISTEMTLACYTCDRVKTAPEHRALLLFFLQ